MNPPLINIHTHHPDPTAICLVTQRLTASAETTPPAPPYTAAIHPWDADRFDTETRERLLNGLIKNKKIAAIGETGLDYACNASIGAQQQLFEKQLEIAQARKLPVVLHCVRAFEPTLKTLAGFDLAGVIFHGFIGSRVQAMRAVEAGYYLSFGERSLHSPKTVDALRNIPLERMFLETDDAPGSVAETYTRTAALLDLPMSTLTEIIYKNYKTLFE